MIDDHVHPFPLRFERLQLSSLTLDAGAGADGDERRARLGPTRLVEETLRVRLARFLGCEPAELEAVRDARASGGGDGGEGGSEHGEDATVADSEVAWTAYVRALFADAGTSGMLLDAGWQNLPTGGGELYAEAAGVPVWEMARLEPLVDGLLEGGADARQVVDELDTFMEARAAAGAVCFKTVLAYRTGLGVDPSASLESAERGLGEDRAAGVGVRRSGKALRDLLFRRALGRCADLDVPIQVHTGYGDSDIRLAESDPLLLEEVLRTSEGTSADVVLIHGSFPWHEQAAYLASVRPRVWTELSLCNLLSPATTADRLLRILDVAPTGKVTLGSDGHGIPESHWFGAVVLRDAWQEVRRRLGGSVTAAWLERTGDAIFEDNARRLYHLPSRTA